MGECRGEAGPGQIEPEPASASSSCFIRGVADDSSYAYCYDYAGNVMARGFASGEGYLEVFVPASAHTASASIFGFDAAGIPLTGCAVYAEGPGYRTQRDPLCAGMVTFDLYGQD